ncbi:hypothetical protein GN956_G16477 [Arapaima gigas]
MVTKTGSLMQEKLLEKESYTEQLSIQVERENGDKSKDTVRLLREEQEMVDGQAERFPEEQPFHGRKTSRIVRVFCQCWGAMAPRMLSLQTGTCHKAVSWQGQAKCGQKEKHKPIPGSAAPEMGEHASKSTPSRTYLMDRACVRTMTPHTALPALRCVATDCQT